MKTIPPLESHTARIPHTQSLCSLPSGMAEPGRFIWDLMCSLKRILGCASTTFCSVEPSPLLQDLYIAVASMLASMLANMRACMLVSMLSKYNATEQGRSAGDRSEEEGRRSLRSNSVGVRLQHPGSDLVEDS